MEFPQSERSEENYLTSPAKLGQTPFLSQKAVGKKIAAETT